jgi:hypothetical protein
MTNFNSSRAVMESKTRKSLRSDSPEEGVFKSTILCTKGGTSRTSMAPDVSSSTVKPAARSPSINGYTPG